MGDFILPYVVRKFHSGTPPMSLSTCKIGMSTFHSEHHKDHMIRPMFTLSAPIIPSSHIPSLEYIHTLAASITGISKCHHHHCGLLVISL